MTAQRIAALLIILIEVSALVYMLEAWLFPAIVLTLALVALSGVYQRELSTNGNLIAVALIAIGCIAKWLIIPYTPPGTTVTISGDIRYLTIQFACCCQIGLLFIHANRGIAAAFPLYGAVTFASLGAIHATAEIHFWFGLLSIAFAAAAALFYGASGKLKPKRKDEPPAQRWALTSVALIGALLLAAAVAFSSHRFRKDIDAAFYKLVKPIAPTSTVGFSNRAQLGSVARMQGAGPRKVGLRIYANDEPGYLRGKSYTSFNGQTWGTDRSMTTLPALTQTPPELAGISPTQNLFQLRQDPTPPFDRLNTHLVQEYHGVLFAPLDVAYATTKMNWLDHDEDQILDAGVGVPLTNYATCHPQGSRGQSVSTTEALQVDLRDKYLAIPTGLDPRIQTLAQEIFADRPTTESKLYAIKHYFISNYDYELGITVPQGEDPLTYFLFEKPPAHCEYFAASTAILLRLVGIPTRYITGFYASERNPYGNYYVARNKDAHAWVEAYDPDKLAWVLVESTPPAGIPSSTTASRFAQLWDYLKETAATLAATFGTDMKEFFRIIGKFILTTAQILVTTLFGGILLTSFALLIAYRFYKRPPRPTKHAPPPPQHLIPLHTLLIKMDQHLRTWNLERAPTETPHQFAQRITTELPPEMNADRISTWYKDYAVLRFTTPENQQEIEKLRRALNELDAATK